MDHFTTRPEIRGTFGVAASTHWLASQVAMSVLERGGNAFDAAVAGGFVLQIVEPHLNGPGGEVPILFWSESEKRIRSLCGQGVAPQKADSAYFLGRGMELVPGIGLLPATVPGAFGAWLTLLRDYGTWELGDILRPAIEYARDGFPLVPRVVQAIVAVQDLFREHWPSSASVWLPGGRAPHPGRLFSNAAVAATYSRLVGEANSQGSDRKARIDAALRLWYRGFVAEAIDDFYRNTQVLDCTGERHAGLLRREDLAEWKATYEDPALLEYGRYTVAKCGPWSQGPIFLQQLAMLQHSDIASHGPNSAGFVHRVAEAAKLAMADRLAWYGDPRFVDVPMSDLLSAEYSRSRMAQVGARAATGLMPGQPRGRQPRLPDLDVANRVMRTAQAHWGVGEPTFADLPPVETWVDAEVFVGDTCHIDVIDREGDMVCATPSGGWLSSSPVIPQLGFSLNTRLQMTWLDEGVPGCLQPGKRPTTTLSPGLALRDGEPYMVFGTPGGDQQDQWALAFFLRHATCGLNLQEAIDSPAWHVEHYPMSFWPRTLKQNRLLLESRFTGAVVDELAAMGHEVVVGGPWSEGRLTACSQEAAGGARKIFKAAANPRGMQGYAVGR